MKKTILKTVAFSLAFTAMLTSCSSTKNVDTAKNDSYSNNTETLDTEELDNIEDFEDSDEADDYESDVVITKKKKKNAFEDFFTFGNKDDFVSSDESYVFTNTLTGTIKQKKATILINPEKGTAGFGSSYMSAYYITQFDAESRAKLTAAVSSYLSDFENKRLDRKSKKSFKKYGEINIHLDWGTLKSSTPSNADGKACIGYMFEKGSPYFTITIYPLHNNHWDIVEDAVPRESMLLKYYFTKALAQDFVNMISEENIAKFMETYTSDTIYVPVSGDDYE